MSTEHAEQDSPQHLQARARSLRAQADHLDDLLAQTYRRRAAELELEAWLLEVRSGDEVAIPA